MKGGKMLYVGRFVKWLISVCATTFFILIAIIFFYGALGVFYLHNTSNWNSIPLFATSALIIFLCGWRIQKEDSKFEEKNKKLLIGSGKDVDLLRGVYGN